MAILFKNPQVTFSTTDISTTSVPSDMSIADLLLDTLYSGDTSEEDRREAHHIWLTWFRKQPAAFQFRAVQRYRGRRERTFESMYADKAVSDASR